MVLGEHAECDVAAVSGLERAIARDAASGSVGVNLDVACSRLRCAGPGREQIGHRDIDAFSLPCLQAPDQGGADRKRGGQTTGEIGDRYRGYDRLPTVRCEGPGPSLIVEIVARYQGKRPVLAEPGERAVDDVPVDIAYGVISDTQPLGDSRAEALYDDVSLGREV